MGWEEIPDWIFEWIFEMGSRYVTWNTKRQILFLVTHAAEKKIWLTLYPLE